jgi:hypothetical protein
MELRTDISYKKDILYLSLGIILSVFFMLFTNPNTMSVFLLLWLPVLVFISSYFIFKIGFKLFSSFTELKIKSLAAVLATGPALVIVLGSLGSIGIQDIVLAFLLVGGLSWYLRRFQSTDNTTRL